MAAHASVLSNVNRLCQPTGPTDFESFSAALTFGAGASLDIHVSTNGSLLPDTNDSLFAHNVTFGSIPSPGSPGCFVVADDKPAAADASSVLAGDLPAPTGTLRAAAEAVPTFDIPKIEAYYSANGALPTNVNYTQLVQATTVPDDLKSAVEKLVGNAGDKGKGNGAGLRYDLRGPLLVGGMVALSGLKLLIV
jgi:hypothetical protein